MMLSGAQMAALATARGLSGEPAAIALAVAKSESGWRADARNVNAATRDDSHGLWQVNLRAHPHLGPAGRLHDPGNNADAMIEISRGGTHWTPWSDFRSGKYLQFMPEARAALQGTPASAIPGNSPAAVEPFTSTATPVPPRPYDPSVVVDGRIPDLSTLRIEGDRISGDLRDVLVGAWWETRIDGCTSIELELRDPHGTWRRSELFSQETYLHQGNQSWILAFHRVRGSRLTVRFDDWVAVAPQRQIGFRPVPPDQLSRSEFVKALANEARVPAEVQVGDTTRIGISRGAEESSWAAGARLARERQLRSFSDGYRWLFGSDEWLASRADNLHLRARSGGVGDLEWTIDTGQPVDQLTFDARSARWALRAGQPIAVIDQGPASGEVWLVANIRGNLLGSAIRGRLERRQQPLPEPDPPPDLSADIGAGPYTPGAVLPVGAVSSQGFMWPVPGGRVISEWWDCRTGLTCSGPCCRRHKGIDIGAPTGTPIVAPKAGVVSAVTTGSAGYGNAVHIDHGGGLVTVHAHCDTIAVTRGQPVAQGQVIGTVGHTGNASPSAPHNHMEVRRGGLPMNPRSVLP